MKPLITCLTFFFLCLGFRASAQSVAPRVGTGTVTSRITVRIPAFASLMLAENKTTTVTKNGLSRTQNPDGSKILQANQKWLTNVSRTFEEVDKPTNGGPSFQKNPLLNVVYTATPE